VGEWVRGWVVVLVVAVVVVMVGNGSGDGVVVVVYGGGDYGDKFDGRKKAHKLKRRSNTWSMM
jgi:hypothetical protein